MCAPAATAALEDVGAPICGGGSSLEAAAAAAAADGRLLIVVRNERVWDRARRSRAGSPPGIAA